MVVVQLGFHIQVRQHNLEVKGDEVFSWRHVSNLLVAFIPSPLCSRSLASLKLHHAITQASFHLLYSGHRSTLKALECTGQFGRRDFLNLPRFIGKTAPKGFQFQSLVAWSPLLSRLRAASPSFTASFFRLLALAPCVFPAKPRPKPHLWIGCMFWGYVSGYVLGSVSRYVSGYVS